MSRSGDRMTVSREELQQLIAEAIAVEKTKNPTTGRKKPKLDHPRFKGNKDKADNFILLFENFLQYYQDEFNGEDELKIQALVNCMEGSALTWYDNYQRSFRNDNAGKMSFDTLWKTFKEYYIDPEKSRKIKNRIEAGEVKQRVNQTVQEYQVYFDSQTIEAGIMDAADKIHHFRKGLLPFLQDAVIGNSLNTTCYSTAVNQIIQIETDHLMYKRKHSEEYFGPSKRQRMDGNRSVAETNGKIKVQLNNQKVSNSEFKTKGDFIDNEEKQYRRRNKLCIKCGSKEHMLKDCHNGWKSTNKLDLLKRKEESGQYKSNEVNANQNKVANNHYLPISPLLLVPLRLWVENNFISTFALIDNGCNSNLIDKQFVKQYGIPIVDWELQHNLPLNSGIGTNGKSQIIGKVEGVTQELKIQMETVTFSETFAITSLSTDYPVVFSIHWLKKHNPEINWETNVLMFKDGTVIQGVDLTDKLTDEQVPTIILNGAMIASGAKNPIPTEVPEKYKEFEFIFSKEEAKVLPPHRPEFDCKIEFIDTDVKKLPKPRPMISLDQQKDQLLKDFLTENLSKGFIEKSTSPIAASFFFVKKADGGWRPTLDYRDLNAVTKKNQCPLPLLDELIARLSGAKIFTKIDLRSAYNLLRIRAGDEWKTSFRCKYGQFQSLVMNFGLQGAPSHFQQWLNYVFQDLLDVCVLVYLDDICIFSKKQDEHTEQVKEVLSRLTKNKMFIKLEKCVFDATKMEFLGFKIDEFGVSMCSKKVDAIMEWPEPKSKKGIMSFLGFIGFYRRFVRNFSKIAKPLTDLTKHDIKFDFNEAAKSAFITLKKALSEAPILKHIDMNIPFRLETDSSDFAIGAVLIQVHNGFKHPVAFKSKKLQATELRFSTHDKELYAIIEALRTWRHYLLSTPYVIEIYCDHRNLLWFRDKQLLNARHGVWAMELMEYNFKIIYTPGPQNVIADTLSRREDHAFGEGEKEKAKTAVLLPSTLFCQNTILSNQSERNIPDDSDSEEEYSEINTVTIEEINKKTEILDESQQLLITKLRHDAITAGHLSARKTLKAIQRNFYWKGMSQYVQKYVRSCDCQRNKSPRHKPFGLLHAFPFSETPWTEISIDFVVKLPISNNFDSICVITDRGLTKQAHFIPCTENITAEETAMIIFKEIFRLHGLPSSIISDRGPQFVSRVWKYVMKCLKVKVKLSTAFHPQTDGATERTNSVMEQYLRNYVCYAQDDWSQHLPFCEFAYNNAYHDSLQTTPFYALTGVNPRSDFLILKAKDAAIGSTEKRLSQLKEIQANILLNLNAAQADYKKYADRKRLSSPFKVGEQVWLLAKNIKTTRPSKKLDHKRLGPFKIIEKIGEEAWRLQLPLSLSRIHDVFHSSLLEPFHENEIPNRIIPPPPAIELENTTELEYEVAQIKDCKRVGKGFKYLVGWKGYGVDHDTWEPPIHVEHCEQLLKDFHNRYPTKPQPRNNSRHLTQFKS